MNVIYVVIEVLYLLKKQFRKFICLKTKKKTLFIYFIFFYGRKTSELFTTYY